MSLQVYSDLIAITSRQVMIRLWHISYDMIDQKLLSKQLYKYMIL